jgi:hypothetical protein
VLACAASACATVRLGPPVATSLPPAELLGEFEDDYESSFRITATEWMQVPSSRLHIVRWVPTERYLVAQNDAANRDSPGLWTRIDWVELDGMPPYKWGFCLSAYKAATRREAEETRIARRETPKTGCNGFPFSRMRRR